MRTNFRLSLKRDCETYVYRLAMLVAGLALAACVPLQPYHTDTTPRECGDVPDEACRKTVVEKHEQYLLGFVEFDDLGWAFDRERGRVLFRELEQIDEEVVMVLFVHGWKHNADPCDTNVTCFRQTLRGLYDAEKALYGDEARRIVGIYVGWRGDSVKGLARQFSFFGRKATAHKVGSGALTELIVRLKEVRRQQGPDSRLVIVGHSFGGAAVFSATSQLMMDRLTTAAYLGGEVRGLADLVVLVNPAFEAARYQPLHATLNEETVGSEDPDRASYPPNQAPVVAIFTSKGDGATGKWFPRGRFLSARKDKSSSPLQKQANRAAVGHFEPFRSHSLALKAPEQLVEVDESPMKSCGCPYESASQLLAGDRQSIEDALSRLRAVRKSGAEEMDFGKAVLRRDRGPEHSPIIVASVDDSIIKGHNDIYRPAFIDFLRVFIMLAAQKEPAPEKETAPAAAPAGP